MRLWRRIVYVFAAVLGATGFFWFLGMAIWPEVFPFYPIGPGLMAIAIFVAGLALPGDAGNDDVYLFANELDCDADD